MNTVNYFLLMHCMAVIASDLCQIDVQQLYMPDASSQSCLISGKPTKIGEWHIVILFHIHKVQVP